MMEAHNIRILLANEERGIVAYRGWCDLCERPDDVLEFSNSEDFQGLAVCQPCLHKALEEAGWLDELG